MLTADSALKDIPHIQDERERAQSSKKEIIGTDAQFWRDTARDNLERGNLEEALNNIKEAIDRDTTDYRSYEDRSKIFMAQKEFDKAIEAIDDGLEIASDYSWFWIGKVRLLGTTGKIETLAATVKDAMSRGFPTGLEFILQGYLCYFTTGYRTAFVVFSKVGKHDPYYANACLGLTETKNFLQDNEIAALLTEQELYEKETMADNKSAVLEAPPHPGSLMKTVIEGHGLSVYATAHKIEVDRFFFDKIVNGKRSINNEVAEKFAAHFSEITEDQLLLSQVWYDKYLYYHPEERKDGAAELESTPTPSV